MEDEEIAEAAGLPVSEIRSLSWLFSWDEVPVKKLFAFSEACGVDFADSKNLMRQNRYIRSENVFHYLKKHPEWLRTFQPLLVRYTEYRRAEDGGR